MVKYPKPQPCGMTIAQPPRLGPNGEYLQEDGGFTMFPNPLPYRPLKANPSEPGNPPAKQ